MRGGDTDMFGNLVEDAALVGVGAYAARNPNTPGMGIVANVGKFFLYGTIAVILLFVIFFLFVIMFGKPTNAAPPTKEKLTMRCRPEDTPEDRSGQPGCRTGSGNWYASSTY
jgi:uncharacterized membrane protein